MSESKGIRLSARTAARLMAIQAVYQLRQDPGSHATQVLEDFQIHAAGLPIADFKIHKSDTVFFEKLVRGVVPVLESLQETVGSRLTEGWSLERLDRVIQSILLLGTYELIHGTDVPAVVIIDEYVALTRLFHDPTEVTFVNGLLNRLGRSVRSHEFP